MKKETDARFEDLYERYYRRIVSYFVGCGFDLEKARDLAQETFLRVYRSMDNYRGEAEWAFLKKAAHRMTLNEVRRRHAKKRASVEVSLEGLPYEPSPAAPNPWREESLPSAEEQLVESEEARNRAQGVRKAIEELPDNDRACLLLWLAGLKYHQIGGALDLTIDAVKSRLYNAKKRLRSALGEAPDGLPEEEP